MRMTIELDSKWSTEEQELIEKLKVNWLEDGPQQRQAATFTCGEIHIPLRLAGNPTLSDYEFGTIGVFLLDGYATPR